MVMSTHLSVVLIMRAVQSTPTYLERTNPSSHCADFVRFLKGVRGRGLGHAT